MRMGRKTLHETTEQEIGIYMPKLNPHTVSGWFQIAPVSVYNLNHLCSLVEVDLKYLVVLMDARLFY